MKTKLISMSKAKTPRRGYTELRKANLKKEKLACLCNVSQGQWKLDPTRERVHSSQ